MNIDNILYLDYSDKSILHASLFRQKARLLTQLPSPDYELEQRKYDFRKKIADGIQIMARWYKSLTSNYYLKIRNKNNNEIINIPLFNRFNAEYLEIQRHKLYRVKWKHAPRYFLTITIDYSEYPSIFEGYKQLGQEWNRLLSRLKKHDKYIQFLKIYEIQEKHTKNVHIHALLQSKLSFKEIYHSLTLLKVCKIYDLKDLKEYYYEKNHTYPSNHELYYMSQKYILKYISKGIYDIDNITENNAILWALGARVFSVSKGMRQTAPSSSLDLTFEINSNPSRLGFYGYWFKRFFSKGFMSFRTHEFYEIDTNIYEFLNIYRDNG